MKSRKPLIVKPRPNGRSQSQTVKVNRRQGPIYAQSGPGGRMRAKTIDLQQRSKPPAAKSDNDEDFVSDAEITDLRDSLLEQQNPDFGDVGDGRLVRLLQALRDYGHQKATIDEDYDSAQKAVVLSEKINVELNNRNGNNNNNGNNKKTDYLSSSRNNNNNNNNNDSTNNEQEEFEKKWKEKFEKFDEETGIKRSAILDEHKRQKEKFEQTWSNDKPNKYRKPSQHLMQMKKIEKSFANSGDFQRAKEIHKQVEKEMKEEMEMMQENLIRDYEIATKKLNDKQQNQLDTFENIREQNRQLLKAKYEGEKESMNNRERVLMQTRSSKVRNNNYNNILITNRNNSSNDQQQQQHNGERSITKLDQMLLPPLKAPNDPEVVEEINKKKREMAKKKAAFQKQNAEATLQKYAMNENKKSHHNKYEQDEDEENYNNYDEYGNITTTDKYIDDNMSGLLNNDEGKENEKENNEGNNDEPVMITSTDKVDAETGMNEDNDKGKLSGVVDNMTAALEGKSKDKK